MLTRDGHVKLLDFGLATVEGEPEPDGGDAPSGGSSEPRPALGLAPTMRRRPRRRREDASLERWRRWRRSKRAVTPWTRGPMCTVSAWCSTRCSPGRPHSRTAEGSRGNGVMGRLPRGLQDAGFARWRRRSPETSKTSCADAPRTRKNSGPLTAPRSSRCSKRAPAHGRVGGPSWPSESQWRRLRRRSRGRSGDDASTVSTPRPALPSRRPFPSHRSRRSGALPTTRASGQGRCRPTARRWPTPPSSMRRGPGRRHSAYAISRRAPTSGSQYRETRAWRGHPSPAKGAPNGFSSRLRARNGRSMSFVPTPRRPLESPPPSSLLPGQPCRPTGAS